MSQNKNESFREMTIKEKIATVTGITLLITIVAGFIFGLYFFGMAGIFELLGVQYESYWSLVIFVVSLFIVGIIVELFFKAIFILFFRNITGKIKVIFFRIIFEGTSNWLVLFTVDEFMNSIALSLETEIIIALILAILEVVFDDDKD